MIKTMSTEHAVLGPRNTAENDHDILYYVIYMMNKRINKNSTGRKI